MDVPISVRNFFELYPEIEEIGRDDHPRMAAAYGDFRQRLTALGTVVAQVAAEPETAAGGEFLTRYFEAVEDADKRFIGACARAAAEGAIGQEEITRLLMANRFFTQSNRMLVLSMQALTQGVETPNGAGAKAPA